jgi:hypothetical protein
LRSGLLNLISRLSLILMVVAGLSLVGLGLSGSLGFDFAGPSPTPIYTDGPPTIIGDVSPSPSVSGPPITTESPSPSPTFGPTLSPTPVPTPVRAGLFATRVVVPKLGIDLPIVRPKPNEPFPLCDVSEYLTPFDQPGQGGVTYLYAHARPDMFWPLLRENRATGGKSLLGLTVLIYTSDDLVFTYKITEVALHIRDLSVAYDWDPAKGEAVMLQTSESGSASGTKMAAVATLVSFAGADHAAAHPAAHPRVCG